MKKIILAGIIIFYLSRIPILAQEKEKGTALAQEKKQEEKLMKNFGESTEAKTNLVYQEGNLIEKGYYNFWDFYEKINDLGIDYFLGDNFNLPTPVYFRLKKNVKLSYRKEKMLDLSGEDFIFGLSWDANNNILKKKNKRDFKFGLEMSINKNNRNEGRAKKNLSLLGGFRIKF